MPRFRINAVEHIQLTGVARGDHQEVHKPQLSHAGEVAWSTPGWYNGTQTNCTVPAEELHYFPIFVERALTAIRVGIDVSAAIAASVVRLGIYAAVFNAEGELEPGALEADWGTVSSATTGLKEIVISEAISAGYHFLAFSSDAGISIAGPNSSSAVTPPVSGGNTTQVALNDCALTVTIADGSAALPDPATTPDARVRSECACVRLRVAT